MPTNDGTCEQPLPTPSSSAHIHIHDAVIDDLRARKAVGVERYGVPLHPFNGRNALLDAFQEVLDLSVYLKQHLIEREALQRDLAALRALLNAHSCPYESNLLEACALIRRLCEQYGAATEAA